MAEAAEAGAVGDDMAAAEAWVFFPAAAQVCGLPGAGADGAGQRGAARDGMKTVRD